MRPKLFFVLTLLLASTQFTSGAKKKSNTAHPDSTPPAGNAPLDPSAAAGVSTATPLATTSMPAPMQSPFLTVLPDLQTAPAPAWVKPAVRLTYYSASATVAGSQTVLVPDPNGGWSVKSGQSYSEQQVGTSAGEGYTEVNIAADDGKQVALDIRSYGYDPNNKTLWAIANSGGVCAVGAGGDFWINPDALKKLADAPPPNMTVGRLPYKTKTRQYDAIWIRGGAGENMTAWVYDSATGVLLHSAGSSRGANQQVIKQGQGPQAGNLLLTENTLVEQRQLQLPWANAPAPGWIASTKLLDYEGDNAYTTPGVLPLKLPASVKFQFQSHGPDWITCSQTSVQKSPQGMPPQQSQVDRAFGGAEIGGLWISPPALGKVKQFEQIDRDPVTGIVTSLSINQRGNFTVTENGGGMRTDSTYDQRTGLMVSYVHVENTLHITTEFSLKSRQ